MTRRSLPGKVSPPPRSSILGLALVLRCATSNSSLFSYPYRFCELLGLSGDANASCEKAGIERLKVDQTLRGIAQAELAANLLGEAIRRNQREGEAIRCETLELKRYDMPLKTRRYDDSWSQAQRVLCGLAVRQ